MRGMTWACAALLVGIAAYHVEGHGFQCPPDAKQLAFQMLESNIARGQGIAETTASTSQIELGIFQQALREAIASTYSTQQKQEWTNYLQRSVSSEVASLSAATEDSGLPLDRLSIGLSMICEYEASRDESLLPAIAALKESVVLQQRNANGGLWYYDNRNNLSAYHNLSYGDGMFSYPTFAILAANSSSYFNDSFGPSAALKQIQILCDICRISSGLLVHGYDASKAHSWADPGTGASPVVWGRSLAWYTLGLVNSLGLLQSQSEVSQGMRNILRGVIHAQVNASEVSLETTGRYGVWQVVDHPGATFNGTKNFVEASASCMTVFSLLRSSRLSLGPDEALRQRANPAAVGMYESVLQEFLIRNTNGTLSLNGTSSVATLSGDVDFAYYATRPTLLNSLIGTSAFVLAGLEVDRLCSGRYEQASGWVHTLQ